MTAHSRRHFDLVARRDASPAIGHAMAGFLRMLPQRFVAERSQPEGELLVRWLADEEAADGIPSRAVAMSETHATLETAYDLDLPADGILELACGEPSLLIRLPARVLDQHAGREAGRREATIEFVRRVGPDLLQKLAVAGLVDRRFYPRTPISLACEARPADGPERPLHVRILDYSASGVRAISPVPLEIGTQIFVCASGVCALGAASVTLRVIRTAKQGEECLLGCVFENRTGYFRFKSLLADDAAPPTLDRGRDWSWFQRRA